jgi:hypothetical protein
VPLLGDAELVVARPGPDAVEHGEGGGLPSVQSLHSARMPDSLVGIEEVMIGLILRPLMPPTVVDLVDEEMIALPCSVYSTSPAKPSSVESASRFTTGKTTLICVFVTPRELVLAHCSPLPPNPLGGQAKLCTGPGPAR